MNFEEWWSRHAIEEAKILPILKLSFKELAKSAWEAALYNNTQNDDKESLRWPDGEEFDYTP